MRTGVTLVIVAGEKHFSDPVKTDQANHLLLLQMCQYRPGFLLHLRAWIHPDPGSAELSGRKARVVLYISRQRRTVPRQDALSGGKRYMLIIPYQPTTRVFPSCQGWIAVAAKRWARVGPLARLPTVPSVPLPGQRSTGCSARRPPSALPGSMSAPSDPTSAPTATAWTQQRVTAATARRVLR